MAGGGTGCSAGRRSALTRRYVGVDDGFVNCGPAKGYVWPVLAPAKGFCARGSVCAARRLSRGAVFVLCRSCDSIGMSCVCSRPSCVPLGMSCVCSRPSCVPFGMSCVCSRPSYVSLGMSCVRSRLSLRFPRGVLCSLTPAVCRLCAKQDGLRDVAFLFRRGSGSPVARSRIVGAVIEGGWFTSGLRVFWRRSRRKTRRTESAARQSAFCVNISALPCFPRGVRWGYAPQTAPKSH